MPWPPTASSCWAGRWARATKSCSWSTRPVRMTCAVGSRPIRGADAVSWKSRASSRGRSYSTVDPGDGAASVDETQKVAVSPHRVQEPRRADRLDLAAQVTDVNVDDRAEPVGLGFPYPLGKVGALHDLAGVTHQNLENAVLPPRESDRNAAS